MALLQDWQSIAYNKETDKNKLRNFWQNYFMIEKGIYQKLLANPEEVVRGTVKELADKYEIDVLTMTGFLDGIKIMMAMRLCANVPLQHGLIIYTLHI